MSMAIPSTQPNPWGLNDREVQVLDAMIATGCMKRALDVCCMSEANYGHWTTSAKRKAEAHGVPTGRLSYLLAWDRFRRDQAMVDTEPPRFDSLTALAQQLVGSLACLRNTCERMELQNAVDRLGIEEYCFALDRAAGTLDLAAQQGIEGTDIPPAPTAHEWRAKLSAEPTVQPRPPHVEGESKALAYYKAVARREFPAWVPATIRTQHELFGDGPFRGPGAPAGVHPCHSNAMGAISIKDRSGAMLGVKPAECEVLTWRPATTGGAR